METTALFIQLAGVIVALSTITAILKNEISKDIRNLDYNNSKTYLTDFLADYERGVHKSEIQKERACEVYKHYITERKQGGLGGNSFVQSKWESLRIFKDCEEQEK